MALRELLRRWGLKEPDVLIRLQRHGYTSAVL
jgi:hypothetical protein